MHRMLARFFRSQATSRRVRPMKRALQVEALEKRDLMAIAAPTLTGGVLRVVGDAANDQVEIRETSGGPIILLQSPGKAAAASTGTITVKDLTNNNSFSFERSQVQRIEVDLGAGDDRLVSDAFVTTAVQAGSGNDYVETGSANDVISGGEGNDTIVANGGNDMVSGEGGNDDLFGGDGNDTLFGGAGGDLLRGGAGNDHLFGGDSTAFNELSGETGNDRLFSSSRNDVVDGGAGRDALFVLAGTRVVRFGEEVTIATPTDQPQTDGFSCGPNSGSRLLRAYGMDVSYNALRRKVKSESVLFRFRLGTRPSVLHKVLKGFKSDLTLKTKSSIQEVLDKLAAGKPVIALIATKSKSLSIGGKIGILHYVVLNGFNLDNQTLQYVDTNGAQKTFTFADFDHKWKWFDHFTGFLGEGAQKVVEALGLRKRTIIS